VSANIKVWLAKAAWTSSLANPEISDGSAVLEITNSTGKSLPPGRGGGVVMIIRIPDNTDIFPHISGSISNAERERMLEGFKSIPENPLFV
jgi:hypothetical protein